VTGGAGFIGANFVRWWLARHPEDRVVVLDALTYAGNLGSLEPVAGHAGYRFVHGDIRTPGLAERLLREHAVAVVVHFAAESHVDRSIHGPDAFLDTNVTGTHELLKAARAVGVERFHHVSTDEVYGSLGPGDPAFTEATAFAPNSPYAASKAAADHLVRAYHHTYGLPVTTTNCSNNYGPYQFPEKLIPLMLVNALAGKPLPIYGDGRNVRDWLYVEDHCHGVMLALERGEPGAKYNLGGFGERANIEIVDTLCAELERVHPAAENAALVRAGVAAYADLKRFVTDRPGHDRRYAIDSTRAQTELGWRPAHDLAAGLAATVQWYLDHRDWCEAVQSGRYRRERLGLIA
jgi:dTDP-glucose 4,6-dehydratase